MSTGRRPGNRRVGAIGTPAWRAMRHTPGILCPVGPPSAHTRPARSPRFRSLLQMLDSAFNLAAAHASAARAHCLC